MGLSDRDYQKEKHDKNTLRDKFKEHEKTLRSSRRATGGDKRISGILVLVVLVVALFVVWAWR
jgi:cell division protein FtsL